LGAVPLKLRVLLLIVALMTAVVATLSLLQLDGVVDAWSDGVQERAEFAGRQMKAVLLERIADGSAQQAVSPATLDESKQLWSEIVAEDRAISTMLERTMAYGGAIVEINVAGEDGRILASSNPTRKGGNLAPLAEFAAWRSANSLARLADLLTYSRDFAVVIPLGVREQPKPVFQIQVAVSSVLLREALSPQVRSLALVSLSSLVLAILLGLFTANLALRPLNRVAAMIDRLRAGGLPSPGQGGSARTPELAIVESKLNLLGERLRLDPLAAISHLTGGVAHEIKNPLNAIALRLEILRGLVTARTPEADPEIALISKEIMRLDRVVKTFLDFTRPLKLDFREVNLAMLAREVATLVAPEASRRNVRIEIIAPPESVVIRGDRDHLKQALLNIVMNGVEAMKDGGQLRMEVARDEGHALVRVIDQGPGIPPELREKVFRLYFTTKEKGSGIGLAMAFRAVQLHGGTLDYADTPNHGCTFILKFPAEVTP
jgi:signal transduction histidine kinase